MTVARMAFFSKKRDHLVVTSKTPDRKCPVRSFASLGNSFAFLWESNDFSLFINRYFQV